MELVKPPQTIPQPLQKLVEPWWNPGKTLWTWWNLYLNPGPRRWRNPGATSWNLTSTTDHPAALAEPGETLVEPLWNQTTNPAALRNLVKRWWNPQQNLVKPCLEPWWWKRNFGGALVEPYLKPFRTTPALAEPGGNLVNLGGMAELVEPYLKPLAEPCGYLVEPW